VFSFTSTSPELVIVNVVPSLMLSGLLDRDSVYLQQLEYDGVYTCIKMMFNVER